MSVSITDSSSISNNNNNNNLIGINNSKTNNEIIENNNEINSENKNNISKSQSSTIQKPKKNSRLSLLINQQIEQKSNSYNDYKEVYNNINENNINEEEYYENNNNLITEKINIEIEINIIFEFEDTIHTIILNIDSNEKIINIIQKAIEEFNNKDFETVIKKKEFIIHLNEDDLDKYKLKKSKKNKKPKNDYPPFNNECLLKDIDCKRFNLLFENSVVILNKKINLDKKDNSCIIF
jgi:hypothetical protein